MSLENNLARNIRSMRESRGATQEQLATALNISYQAVSKWENGVSVPDTMLLPKIAQYFDTSIDSLFCSETRAYTHEAERLLSIYEQSRNQDDFIRADAEYRRLFESGNYCLNDLRSYGVLYEYHMYYCRDKALEQYDRVLASQTKDEIYFGTKQQKMLLLSQIGRSGESIAETQKELEKGPEEIRNHICLIAAYAYAGQYEEGLQALHAAEAKFPVPNSLLCTYGGDLCRQLKRYDEAFSYWNRALEASDKHIDSLYSMAFCYHDLGQYEEAISTWQRVIDWLLKRGYIHEAVFPKKQIRAAKEALLTSKK